MDKQKVTDKHKRIQSIDVGFTILRTLAERKRAMSLNELAKETGLHKSQLYRYLNTFVDLGVLLKSEEDIPHWSLGPELIALGSAAFEGLDVARVATSSLVRLRDTLNETVALSIWREKGPFFVRWERSNKLVNIGLDTGSYVPLYTATGKIYRSFLPQEQTQLLYEQEVEAGNIDPETYDAEIERIRKTGLASTESSIISGVTVISTPVFYSSAKMAGAVSVIGVSGAFDISPSSMAVRELFKTAETISRKLGYHGHFPPEMA